MTVPTNSAARTGSRQAVQAVQAAEAAVALLPASTALGAGEPVSAEELGGLDGRAIHARFSGSAQGEIVIVVDRGQRVRLQGRQSPGGLAQSKNGNRLPARAGSDHAGAAGILRAVCTI